MLRKTVYRAASEKLRNKKVNNLSTRSTPDVVKSLVCADFALSLPPGTDVASKLWTHGCACHGHEGGSEKQRGREEVGKRRKRIKT